MEYLIVFNGVRQADKYWSILACVEFKFTVFDTFERKEPTKSANLSLQTSYSLFVLDRTNNLMNCLLTLFIVGKNHNLYTISHHIIPIARAISHSQLIIIPYQPNIHHESQILNMDW
ncbi:17588_t:CDS:2, partial [Funneliformis geosporum]